MIGFGRIWGGAAGHAGPQTSTKVPQSTLSRVLPGLRSNAAVEPDWSEPDAEPNETRAGDRFVPRRTSVALTMASGKKISARIMNVSLTGVAVEADFGSAGADKVVMVGSRTVVAGRRIALGRVFLFEKPLDPKVCHTEILL